MAIKNCFAFGMAPAMMETAVEMNCFIHQVLQKLRISDLQIITNIIDEFHDAAANTAVHLPLSDEGCPGKLTWCGVGKPLTADILNELSPFFAGATKESPFTRFVFTCGPECRIWTTPSHFSTTRAPPTWAPRNICVKFQKISILLANKKVTILQYLL